MGKSASVTIGQGSLNHNNRVFTYRNVDPALTAENVILVQKSLKEAYQEIFGAALEKYNQTRKYNSQKIRDYLAKVQGYKNGKKPFYEIIAQVGDRYNTGIGSPDAEIAKGILAEYLKEFVERNPNMIVFNAIIHMDERDGTPHLHIDFIPIARDQKRGLETQNSFTQALKQQGFVFAPTPEPPQDPNIDPYYGEQKPRYPTSQWTQSEGIELGHLLERQGIAWEKQDVHRRHLSIPEFKACAEIAQKIIREMPPVELDMRIPNSAMRIVGVKQGEVIVSRQKIEALQTENKALRGQAKIAHDTIRRMDEAQIERNAFVRRTLKAAEVREQRAKDLYSPGTAEKYRNLVEEYNSLADKHNALIRAYKDIAAAKKKLDKGVQEEVSRMVKAAVQPLTAEIDHLMVGLSASEKRAADAEAKVYMLGHTIHDIMRATFMLKYGDKLNPYRSVLTDKANYLIDALERKAHAAMQEAGCSDCKEGLNGMGITKELLDDIHRHSPKDRPKKRELER